MNGATHRAFSRLWSTDPLGMRDRLLGTLLAPAAVGFACAARIHRFAFDHGWLRVHSSVLPVLSVGGLEVGGVGKTPLVAELVRCARASGFAPAVLTRGYGGAGDGAPIRVPEETSPDSAERFGDEPVLLRELLGPQVPIWVSRDRVHSARLAAHAGADLLILDDGFQHRRLHRDADVVCLSGARPFGNGRLLPLGPLRETPSALLRATRVVLSDVDPGTWPDARAALLRVLPTGLPVDGFETHPTLRVVRGPTPAAGAAVLLLTGVAHPERVARSVRALGFDLIAQRADPDHHPWTEAELRSIAREANGLPILTTAKDWMRIRARGDALASVSVVDQTLEWLEPSSAAAWSSWILGLARK